MIIVKINGIIKERYGNKELGKLEIVSFDSEALEINPHPDRVNAHLKTTNLEGEIITSEKGILAGINDPAQPLTFAIAVDTLKKEIEYAQIIIFFNEKKKFKGKMFPPNESIMLACARDDEEIGKMKENIEKRRAKELKIVAEFDDDKTSLIISQFKQNAINIHQEYNRASPDEIAALL